MLLKSCWRDHALVPAPVLCWIVRFGLEEMEETKSREMGEMKRNFGQSGERLYRRLIWRMVGCVK